MASEAAPILAAGAVMWRPSAKHGIKVALVHRPRYGDWSLPKGKVARRESVSVTAVREVGEETGFAIVLGRQVTTVSYPVSAGHKTVHYFAGRAGDGKFKPSKEVDDLVWLPVRNARKALRHAFDRGVLDAFCTLPPSLPTLLLVRHAHAGQRESFTGIDEQRPLDTKGFRQADLLTTELAAFAPASVWSAPLARCRQTVQPIADRWGLPIGDEPLLSEAEYQRDPASARRRITELALRDGESGPALVCSQGGVIPGVVKSLASRSGVALPTTATPKGAFWLLSFDGKQMLQADRYLLTDS